MASLTGPRRRSGDLRSASSAVSGYSGEEANSRHTSWGSPNLYPNPKNLYVRLLAEMGLPGLILYVSFLFTMLAYTLKGLRQAEPFWRFIGTAGFFSVAAIAAQGISQDSFAMPEMWVNLGILAGVVAFALESEKKHASSAGNGGLSVQETR